MKTAARTENIADLQCVIWCLSLCACVCACVRACMRVRACVDVNPPQILCELARDSSSYVYFCVTNDRCWLALCLKARKCSVLGLRALCTPTILIWKKRCGDRQALINTPLTVTTLCYPPRLHTTWSCNELLSKCSLSINLARTTRTDLISLCFGARSFRESVSGLQVCLLLFSVFLSLSVSVSLSLFVSLSLSCNKVRFWDRTTLLLLLYFTIPHYRIAYCGYMYLW